MPEVWLQHVQQRLVWWFQTSPTLSSQSLPGGPSKWPRPTGYSILLCNTGEDVSREIEVLNLLHERYVDGVIVCGFRQEDAPLQKALSQFNAVVLVNRRLEGESKPAVLVDDVLGGYLVTQHLLQMGHTAVGFVAGPTCFLQRRRTIQGYKQALQMLVSSPRRLGEHCTPTSRGWRRGRALAARDTSGIISLILL